MDPVVEIVLKEGPISLPSLAGSGVENTYALWNEMSASEFFPTQVASAFYVLSLSKSVRNANEVFEAEADLVAALRLLCSTWPFAGGSFVILDTRDTLVSGRFESNARRVHEQLLATVGEKAVVSSSTIAYESLATYTQPPLQVASLIARAAIADNAVHRLLAYHQAAWVGYYGRSRNDRSSWFIDLLKSAIS